MVRGPRDENVLSTGVCSPFLQCNVNQRRRIPRRSCICPYAYGRRSAPIAQGLVYDMNAPHAFGLRESKPNAMHTYGRSSAPIAQGLVYDMNAPHAFGLRESKPNAMHAYGCNERV